MGFDNECIINIQSLAGEYFCPVCRLLVYPNEALQSQCTHLYCKPCLAYVVGTTKACPYDGYLVTEADSKPLVESNKVLADTIWKLAVHCLYHRSGCTWQGPLSDCISHCSSCTFGNSPVVCNRCSIQIVHRQVQEHAQSCPGVPSQAQQTATVQDVVPTGSSAPPPDPNQIIQTGATPHIPHGPALVPVSDVTQHPVPAQAHVIGQAAAPTPEQWYQQQQQQYQQYYQQYPGYDPYQQQYQQYYPYQQQQPGQQYPLPQTILQPQQSSVPPQIYHQQQQPQNQPPMQPQLQSQFPAQILPQQPPLQPPPHQPIQTPFAPQNQKPAPVLHPHSHSQFPPQTQPYTQIPPQPVQHPQTQPPPPPQFPQNYPGVQLQPRPPSQPGQQQPLPNSQPLTQHPSALAVTGNQSYPQPHMQQLHQGGVQPHHSNMQVQSGSFQKPQHQSSIPAQVSQPSPQVRPQQQSALFPTMGQAQIQPAYLPMQQPNHPSQPRPTVQSGQQLPPQFLQQNQPPNMPLNQLQQQQQPSIPRPQGPPHTYPQPQQDSLVLGLQHQQMQQNQVGVQSYPQIHSGHPPPGAPVRPSQPGVGQNTVNQNYPPRNNHLPPEQHIGYIQPDSQLDPPSTIKPLPIHDIQRNVVSTKGLPENEADQSLKKSNTKHEVELITPQTVSNDIRDSVKVQRLESDINVDEKGSSYKSNNHIEKQDHSAADHVIEDKNVNYNNIMSQPCKTGIEDKEKLPEPPRKVLSTKHDFIDANGKMLQGEKPDGSSHPIQNEKEISVVDAPMSEQGKNLAAPVRDVPQDRNVAEANSSSFQSESYRGFHPSADMQVRGTAQPSHHHISEMGPNNPHMVRPNVTQQQRPAAPFIPQQAFPPGQFNQSQMPEFLPPPPPPPHLFPQGQGMVPLQGPPLAPEMLQPLNQPHGFPQEAPPGGMMGGSYPGQYGPAPNQYGPGERNIDPQLAATYSHGNLGQPNLGGRAPQGEYGVNPGIGAPIPGSFDPSTGMFPLRAPQNTMPHYRPNIPTETEIFSGQRPNLTDSRPPGVHGFGSSDHGPFDPRNMMQSANLGKMNGFRRLDSPSALGMQNDRFNPPMENVNPFMVEPIGRAPDRRIFEEDLKLFPRYPESSRHGEGGNSNLRSFDRDHKGFRDDKPTFPIGGLHYPNDGGERIHHMGFHDDGRHRVDPRSPNREHSSINPRGFGGFSGPSMNHIGRPDMDVRDSQSYGDIPKPFDLTTDRPGAIFADNRYPPFSNNPHRGDLDMPMNFPHHRNSDVIGQDLMSDQHRHNISNHHHRFGDLAKFGGFPPMGLSKDEPGLENFSQMPFGDSIRTGNMTSHPRIGEPGFRSRYSLPAFPKDVGFHHGGDIDPLDNMRKRTQIRVGWCRICKVDCETVEGLDLHSQTGEHQKAAMDMVINIKLQNSKKLNKAMNAGHDIRNN